MRWAHHEEKRRTLLQWLKSLYESGSIWSNGSPGPGSRVSMDRSPLRPTSARGGGRGAGGSVRSEASGGAGSSRSRWVVFVFSHNQGLASRTGWCVSVPSSQGVLHGTHLYAPFFRVYFTCSRGWTVPVRLCLSSQLLGVVVEQVVSI